MAITIQLKRGKLEKKPLTLKDGELYLATDENKLYNNKGLVSQKATIVMEEPTGDWGLTGDMAIKVAANKGYETAKHTETPITLSSNLTKYYVKKYDSSSFSTSTWYYDTTSNGGLTLLSCNTGSADDPTWTRYCFFDNAVCNSEGVITSDFASSFDSSSGLSDYNVVYDKDNKIWFDYRTSKIYNYYLYQVVSSSEFNITVDFSNNKYIFKIPGDSNTYDMSLNNYPTSSFTPNILNGCFTFNGINIIKPIAMTDVLDNFGDLIDSTGDYFVISPLNKCAFIIRETSLTENPSNSEIEKAPHTETEITRSSVLTSYKLDTSQSAGYDEINGISMWTSTKGSRTTRISIFQTSVFNKDGTIDSIVSSTLTQVESGGIFAYDSTNKMWWDLKTDKQYYLYKMSKTVTEMITMDTDFKNNRFSYYTEKGTTSYFDLNNYPKGILSEITYSEYGGVILYKCILATDNESDIFNNIDSSGYYFVIEPKKACAYIVKKAEETPKNIQGLYVKTESGQDYYKWNTGSSSISDIKVDGNSILQRTGIANVLTDNTTIAYNIWSGLNVKDSSITTSKLSADTLQKFTDLDTKITNNVINSTTSTFSSEFTKTYDSTKGITSIDSANNRIVLRDNFGNTVFDSTADLQSLAKTLTISPSNSSLKFDGTTLTLTSKNQNDELLFTSSVDISPNINISMGSITTEV